MVEPSYIDGCDRLVVKPNRSSSWRQNLWALAAIAVPSLAAAIAFAVLGAWPILPFAGLELLCLGGALYYVNWKLQYRQVVTIGPDTVIIDKGYYAPKRQWRLDRESSRISVTPAQHEWDGPSLAIYDRTSRVPLGEFLSKTESMQLLAWLKNHFPTGTHSAQGESQF